MKNKIWLDYFAVNGESKIVCLAVTQCEHIGDVYPVLELPDDMADRDAAIFMTSTETGEVIESGGIGCTKR